MNQNLMIYGAYGYTGELIVREAMARGFSPILAGRSESKLAPLAQALGLSFRVFETAAADQNLHGVATMLNCAGPFSTTAKPLVEACLSARVHYLDIAGEIPVFQMHHAFGAQAKAAGIVLCGGVGFDVVPTDCLAAMLKERMPQSQTINLAFSFGTRPSIGTVRSIIEGMKLGGWIRRDHRLTQVGNAYRLRRIAFPNGPRWAVTIPWGDVYTAGVTTGVPNGMVYVALPLAVGLLMRITSPLRRLLATTWMQRLLNHLAGKLFLGGPGTEALVNQPTEFWGEAVDGAGQRVAAGMTGPNVYTLTADTALEIAKYCLSTPNQSGYFTPSQLLGSGFFASRPQVTFKWQE